MCFSSEFFVVLRHSSLKDYCNVILFFFLTVEIYCPCCTDYWLANISVIGTLFHTKYNQNCSAPWSGGAEMMWRHFPQRGRQHYLQGEWRRPSPSERNPSHRLSPFYPTVSLPSSHPVPCFRLRDHVGERGGSWCTERGCRWWRELHKLRRGHSHHVWRHPRFLSVAAREKFPSMITYCKSTKANCVE